MNAIGNFLKKVGQAIGDAGRKIGEIIRGN